MKRQRKYFKFLALLMFVLFFFLVAYGGYSVVTYGNRWFASSRNPRLRSQKENVMAGDIQDRNGVVLATTDELGNRVYQSDKAARSAIVHLLGDASGYVANGVESFQTAYLYGFHTSFQELLSDFFTGEERRGDTVRLTIDSKLCTEIVSSFQRYSASRGHNGAAVVMNYETGEILAEISLPNFDPQEITSATLSSEEQPFWNRATQSVYPPGSTFKIVTAAAALEQLPEIETETLTCTGGLDTGSAIIRDFGGAVHGNLSLREAFGVSCNNVFGQLALTLTDAKLRKTAEDFGFNDNFLFHDLVVENSQYPVSATRTPYEVAASGFGQSSIAASPLHMCMIASAVAYGGMEQEPVLMRQVLTPSGYERTSGVTRQYRRMMDAQTAERLRDFMRYTVTSGTGTSAGTGGLPICGKTGTAESTLRGQPVNYGWFVGYIEDEYLPFAVCVLVEDIADGQGGGSTAAPIARDIFGYLLEYPDRVRN